MALRILEELAEWNSSKEQGMSSLWTNATGLLLIWCWWVGEMLCRAEQLSQLKPQSVVSGYAKKVYVAMRAGHIRRCKTRIYGKGAEMYKGIYKKVHR